MSVASHTFPAICPIHQRPVHDNRGHCPCYIAASQRKQAQCLKQWLIAMTQSRPLRRGLARKIVGIWKVNGWQYALQTLCGWVRPRYGEQSI